MATSYRTLTIEEAGELHSLGVTGIEYRWSSHANDLWYSLGYYWDVISKMNAGCNPLHFIRVNKGLLRIQVEDEDE